MTSRRWLAVGFALASLLVGGWKSLIPGLDLASGSSSAQATGELAAAPAFAQAVGALDGYHATAGTYVGAQLPAGSTAQLAWAGPAEYCLQADGVHLVGPGSLLPQPGDCPPS